MCKNIYSGIKLFIEEQKVLKEAKYVCRSYNKLSKDITYNKVAYIIIDGSCYYSGIDSIMDRSTVNSVEDIIESISTQEKVLYTELRWFDLQTCRGYISKKPGQYELDELILSDQGSDFDKVKFIPIMEATREVLEYFKEYIG